MTMRVWIDRKKINIIDAPLGSEFVHISVAGVPLRLRRGNGALYVDSRNIYEPLAELLHEEVLYVTIQDYIDSPTEFLPEGIYRHAEAEVTVKTTNERGPSLNFSYQRILVKAPNSELARHTHSLLLQRLLKPVEAWS